MKEQQEKSSAEERDGKAGREVIPQSRNEAQSDEPIQQRWFFEPRLAPETRSNPIPGFGHLPADRRVPRLIGAEDACRREPIEKQKEYDRSRE
jgi:hypothetical protein